MYVNIYVLDVSCYKMICSGCHQNTVWIYFLINHNTIHNDYSQPYLDEEEEEYFDRVLTYMEIYPTEKDFAGLLMGVSYHI